MRYHLHNFVAGLADTLAGELNIVPRLFEIRSAGLE